MKTCRLFAVRLSKSAIRLGTAVGIAVASGLGSTPAEAQTSSSIAAAQNKMALYTGDWDFLGQGVDTPFQKAAEWRGILHGEWFPGRFGVIRNNVMTGPNAPYVRIIQMLAYDKVANSYRLSEVTEDGFTAVEEVSINDNAIVAHFDSVIHGVRWHMRWTLTMIDANHRRYVREYSSDGVKWLVCWTADEVRR